MTYERSERQYVEDDIRALEYEIALADRAESDGRLADPDAHFRAGQRRRLRLHALVLRREALLVAEEEAA